MLNWPSATAETLRSEFIEIYWILLGIITLIAIISEFFKIAENKIDPMRILSRVTISVILLWSFKDVMNLASQITEAMIDRMGGVANLQVLYDEMKKSYQAKTPSLFKYREMFIYFFSWFCYAVGVFGYFVMGILTDFAYTILYILSPLLILAFVPQQTAYMTKNLYKGIFTVCIWKILWCILGYLLLKFSTMPPGNGQEGFFMSALTNLGIGPSMLMVPVFANSLFGSGLSDMAVSTAGVAVAPLTKGLARIPQKVMGGMGQGAQSAWRHGRNFMGSRLDRARDRSRLAKERKAQDAAAQSYQCFTDKNKQGDSR